MRPHQWVKNSFVLFGLLFAGRWGDWALLEQAGLTFLAFCAVASAVYIGNDLVDVHTDRLHPHKRHRPLASGLVSPVRARMLGVLLVGLGCGLAATVSWPVLALVIGYIAINAAYSLRLKHMPILDVFCICAGFMLRILAGTVGLGIHPSSWLLLCGLMFTLFLGFAKRRAELMQMQQHPKRTTRRVLHAYKPEMLEQYLSISATCTVLSYALYTVSPDTIELHGTDRLIYTVPLIIYGIFRYLLLLHSHGAGQDTARDLLHDRQLLLCVLAWLALTVGLLR